MGNALAPLIACAAIMVSGCASPSWEERRAFEEKLFADRTEIYRTGLAIDDAVQKFGKPRIDVVRPAGGWSGDNRMAEDVNFYAVRAEKARGISVERCLMFYSPGGVLSGHFTFDYLFFDGAGKLVGFHCRKVD